jgi:predicted dehydrogenase
MSNKQSNRRDFIATASTTMILSAATLGLNGHTAPNDKLNIAGIGVGGKGEDDLRNLRSENIVALCDADDERAAGSINRFPDAKVYKDFRVMFDEMDKEIDAVNIATPDHLHAVVAMDAIKRKKHIFCQKPLCHSIWETRMITEAAREAGVITQMGNQGHSSDEIRELKEWIADGAIGEIKEIFAWSDRPVGGDPWSDFDVVPRPKDTPPVPDGLDWDLWLGPVTYRPYHPTYCPMKWRSWVDFGTGAIGDMGCHIMDPAFYALDLGAPEYVEAATTHWEPEVSSETYPRASIVRFKFPKRGNRPAVFLTWYDGRLKPPTPEILSPKVDLGGNGAMYVGQDGVILHGSHGASDLRLLPEEKNKSYKRPEPSIPRVEGGVGGHAIDWVRACKDGKHSSANFEYGGPLTEMALLGVLALRVKDQRLYWDSENLKIKGVSECDPIIHPHFREGWTL